MAFRQVLEKIGFQGSLPRLTASGSRNEAFSDFVSAFNNKKPGDVLVLWVDSEDPVESPENAWAHLHQRDGWKPPDGATEKQVLLMVTSMETWIVADRANLRGFFGAQFNEKKLPALNDALEDRNRRDVFEALQAATRSCSKQYQKGEISFHLLGKLDVEVLRSYLAGFRLVESKLNEVLS